MSKPRFFYAAEVYRTWPKLFVLTSNGVFYCEYLENMQNKTIRKEGFNYYNFSPFTYKCHGYQPIVEIDEDTALKTRLVRQENWISRYLKSL
ncbi:hypothetical protein [Aeromonas sp. Y318-3]|uniref:hypothetical protein n=1 Tax=Aeromonas TaxID=642 RepID=UPI0022E0A5F8|nr:hypothetical protein [Aeromonas sp. Y318-3]